METVRRYNYRAYPTRGQRMALSRLFGACRYAWNWYVRQRLTDWNFNRSRSSYAELSAKFNRTKTEKALEWLTQVSAVPLAQSLRQCEKAYSAFFRYVSMDATSTIRAVRWGIRGSRAAIAASSPPCSPRRPDSTSDTTITRDGCS